MACLLSLNLTIMSLNVIGLIKQLKKSDRTDLKKSLPTVCFYEKKFTLSINLCPLRLNIKGIEKFILCKI